MISSFDDELNQIMNLNNFFIYLTLLHIIDQINSTFLYILVNIVDICFSKVISKFINMKAVIEKIISNYFGKFITGIQGNLTVSIFDGNFQLQNISLNQQYFDSLNTPFKLSYSSIGKLNLQASLSKLSSTPVQCTLDNIYAVFQFRSDGKTQQQTSAEKQILQKKQTIQKYIRDMFQDYLKKLRQKDQKKQDGMMAKLGKKIIDNLQLKIINLHVRFEQNKEGQKYAWGVTLEQISFMTTDNQWKPTFIDRNAQTGKNQKLLKKMNLKNLSIYWQSDSKQHKEKFVGQLKSHAQKAKYMASMIKKSQFAIISLTSEVKLTINETNNFQLPVYQLSVDLQRIVFQLERVQVSEMIDFTHKNISENQQILKNLSLKKKKSKKALQPQEKEKLQQSFQQFVQNYVDNYEIQKQKGKRSDQTDYESVAILRTLVSKVDDEELFLWALKPIRRKVKQTRERQLKKKKKGWFGGEYQLTEQQTKALSNFVEQVTETDEKQRPAECLFFSLKILIKGGKFSYILNKNLQQQQILEFQIGKIDLVLVKSQNDSLLDLTAGVEGISLNLFLPIYGTNEKLKMNILRNLQSEEQQFFDPGEQDKFISLKYCKKVETSQKPIIKTDIIGQIKQIAITYKKVFMKKFKSFFIFQNFNQSMKNETKKKWEQYNKQKNEQKILNIEQENEVIKMFNIQVKIISPLFICPLNQSGGWCVNLGRLSLESQRDAEKEIYPIKVQSAFFRYYPNLSYCLKQMNEQQLRKNQIFCLVKDMNFSATYTNFIYVKQERTDILLPNFEVNFTEKQYSNLISLKDIFSGDNTQNNFFENLKKQRSQVEKNKVFEANIQIKKGQLDKWYSYYGILSGEFIHLYGSQKQLKCIQKVPIKNMRLQYNQQSKVISLYHQSGVIQLMGSQFENNSLKWKDSIALQMKQFMTIYEMVEEMMLKQEQGEVPRKRSPSSNNATNRMKSISFKVEKIGFNYKDDQNKDVIIFKLYGLIFEQHQQNKISKKLITIKKMDSFDYLHKYRNPKLQALISTDQIILRVERNKNDENKKLEIDLTFTEININWKPDVLVIFMKLIYSYISKEVKHRVDDGQERTRQQLFEQVLSDPKFSFSIKQYERGSQGKDVKQKRINFVQKNKRLKELLCLNLVIKRTEVIMIHRQSHLVMFKMIAEDINNQVAMGENQKFVSGSIRSLWLYQMTGYPRQNYTEMDQANPYLIIKAKNPSSLEALISYKWSSYEPFVLPNMQRINSFLYITINPIECHYFQQITFRLIDYILIQIILLLNQPEMLLANENLLEQLKKSPQKQAKESSQAIVKILFSEFQEVIRRIVDPYFMDMYFELKQPSVLLKAEKNSSIYHKAEFKDIVFVNQDVKNGKRFSKCECPEVIKYIYEETYDIMCNSCNFYTVEEKDSQVKEQILFDSVDILLNINKLLMQDQINLIYPELSKYDRSFQTSTKMSHLRISKLSRHQYLLINKLVNYNMIYDDNKDENFIHNFKITKLLSPKPIYYELLIPQIQLTGQEGNTAEFFDLFTMKMNGFKLIYERSADLNSSFRIQLNQANLVGYQYQFQKSDSNEPKQLLMQMSEQVVQKKKRSKKIELMEFKATNKDHSCTQIIVKMKTSGQKIIEMHIQNIQAYLKLHLMQLIFEWCLLENWVFPTVSIYANDITFHLTIHQMCAWLKQPAGSIINYSPRAFKLLGVFCYKFHRKANFSQEHLHQLLKEKKITFDEINKMPEISYMSILLNTQIFHCLAEGAVRTKRQVVEKVTFNMIQKNFYKIANQQLFKINTMTHRKLNFDKGLFKFSFTDILLMRDILSLIGKERQYISKIKELTNPKPKQQEFVAELVQRERISQMSEPAEFAQSQQAFLQVGRPVKMLPPPDSELSTLENLDIEIESLSFYLINNCREAFIPILRLHINNAFINKCNTSKKDMLKTNFQISAFYFNASIFRWQPMLEKVDLAFSKFTHEEDGTGTGNVLSSIQATKPILINISKQMVSAIRDTMQQWNKNQPTPQSQPHKLQQSQLSSSSSSPAKKSRSLNQKIQLVSQYVIRNEIGYPILIYSHHERNKLLYKIPNLQQIYYQYELQKYDDENQVQILIGVEICHHLYKFKRITQISLGMELNFGVVPEINGKNRYQSMENLPYNSIIRFITQTKDSKRYLILKTTKWIEDYLHNTKQITYLPFDHKQTIILSQNPHKGRQISLYKSSSFTIQQKHKSISKYRYIANDGIVKIMGKAMVYNYTPIPLMVNQFYLLPDQFVTISSQPYIQNMRYRDVRGVKVHYDGKNQIYYLYCQGYIVDYAGLFYQIQEAKEFSHQFMNQGLKYQVYLLSDASEKIKVRLEKKMKSVGNIKCSAFIKPAVGNQIFELQNQNNSLCQFQTYGYLSTYTGNEYKDFKKIIEVAPLYILSNTTNFKLKICQISSQQSLVLDPGERCPFFWESKAKPKLIKIAALKDNVMWGYSGPLTISRSTHSFVVRNTSDNSQYRILSLQIQSTNTINFVHIVDCHPKKGNNIMLCNHFEGATLKFYQKAIFSKDYQMLNPLEYIFTVRPGEQIPFGFEVPLESHDIQMQIIFDRSHPRYGECPTIKVPIQMDLQTNLFDKKIGIKTKDNRHKNLLLKLSFVGNVKKLQLMHYSKTPQQITQGQFICKFPQVVFSIVGYQQQVRKEIITIFLNDLELQSAKTNAMTDYYFTVKQIQVQNCLKVSPFYPIVLQSTGTQKTSCFLQFMIKKDNLNSKLIHYLGVSINKFILTITSQQIQCLQQTISQINEALQPQKSVDGIVGMRQYELFRKNNPQLTSSLYFILAEIHTLKCNITFKHVNSWGGTFMKTFASIDNCNLSVTGKKISHFGARNISELFDILRKHYQEGITKVIVPMIGNLAILGSPLSLAQRIGSGFKDLVELPTDGFNNSALQGGKGLAKGAGSLVKNTFQGAFNSIESVAGSVGNGVSSLAFDDQFSRERQKIKNDRSSHIGEGLSNGAKSIVNGFTKGIKGFFTSPVEGAQRDGIGGFFLGGVKGITGLVVKPVSGIIDATSKTVEGIKNTPSYFDKQSEINMSLKRKRNPRIFYTSIRQFRSYDEDLSVSAKILALVDQTKYENLSWYGFYHLQPPPGQQKQKKNPLLLLTHEFLVIHNLSDNKIMQSIRSCDIYEAIYENSTRVKIALLDLKTKKIGNITVQLRQPLANKLTTQIRSICKIYRPTYGFDFQLRNDLEEFIDRVKLERK